MPFSQSLDPVRGVLGNHDKTADGVCRSLVFRWFAEAVKHQSQFWSMMYGQNHSLNTAFIAQIMMMTATLGKRDVVSTTSRDLSGARIADLEDATFRDYFRPHGLKVSLHEPMSEQPDVFGLASIRLRTVYENAAKHAGFTFCLLFGMAQTDGTGHAIGFVIRANQPISLFDPNLGEFGFANLKGCQDWIDQRLRPFYTANSYTRAMGILLFKEPG